VDFNDDDDDDDDATEICDDVILLRGLRSSDVIGWRVGARSRRGRRRTRYGRRRRSCRSTKTVHLSHCNARTIHQQYYVTRSSATQRKQRVSYAFRYIPFKWP